MRLAVAIDQNNFSVEAEKLSMKLKLPLVNFPLTKSELEGWDYLLLFEPEGLGLQTQDKASQSIVRVDFMSARLRHRRRDGHNEILGRACGVKDSFIPSIIDATAGLGTDSFVLADLGCSITLVERSPLVMALLEDGLTRAALSNKWRVAERMILQKGDSVDYLKTLKSGHVDVIYLDPMFPASGKSAKAKKEMQVFQKLANEYENDNEDVLLEESRRVAKYRVVVKRSTKAPYLAAQQPSFDLRGKTIRYDVYTKQKLPQNDRF